MKALKEKFARFLKDDNGMEFIAVAIIVAAGVILAGLIVGLYDTVSGKISGVSGDFKLPAAK